MIDKELVKKEIDDLELSIPSLEKEIKGLRKKLKEEKRRLRDAKISWTLGHHSLYGGKLEVKNNDADLPIRTMHQNF